MAFFAGFFAYKKAGILHELWGCRTGAPYIARLLSFVAPTFEGYRTTFHVYCATFDDYRTSFVLSHELQHFGPLLPHASHPIIGKRTAMLLHTLHYIFYRKWIMG